MGMLNGIRSKCRCSFELIYSSVIVDLVLPQLTLVSFSLSPFCPLFLPWAIFALYPLCINICFPALELQLIAYTCPLTISLFYVHVGALVIAMCS